MNTVPNALAPRRSRTRRSRGGSHHAGRRRRRARLRRPPARRHPAGGRARRHRPRDRRHRSQPSGIPVDAQLRAGEGLSAIGDATGIWPQTHVGQYQGRVVAANVPRRAARGPVTRPCRASPTPTRRPAAVGATDSRFSATALVSDVANTAAYTRAYAKSNGFLTLLSDGERLTGAHALGPEAGEWLQQATLAIHAGAPLEVLPRRDPAVPDVLRDLPGRPHGAARRPHRRDARQRRGSSAARRLERGVSVVVDAGRGELAAVAANIYGDPCLRR